MTFEQFREKLTPFFTPEQIGNLDRESALSAMDAYVTPGSVAELRQILDESRDLTCTVIADYIETEPAFIEKLAGSPISWERRKALIKQMDIEW